MTLSTNTVLNHETRQASTLADFQQSFGRYLREQKPLSALNRSSAIASSSLSNRVGSLYQTLIFNNVCGFLDKCFPVCQSLLSDAQWLQVCHQFFLHYPCHSPYFTEINQHFVDYLSNKGVLESLNLPPFFAELADYEWSELKVDTYYIEPEYEPTLGYEINQDTILSLGLHADYLAVNPTLQNLHYHWPVHQISADFKPSTLDDSFYLVYRNNTHKVQFMTVNALTHALIEFIKVDAPIDASEEALTQLMQKFADHLGFEETTILISFGIPLIQQLLQQQVLLPLIANDTNDTNNNTNDINNPFNNPFKKETIL
ncbi:putative DNA-binding domain-containing protein [Psychrobacter sp.]|uniref:HvfC family RiPP maturation protein n=1 Tax=Psychrobacter sp. TaxID=56811 RepID=UPI0025E6E460|nr:putative DNA-binding domain-containing protein [Psychrobacter sp.]